MPKLQSSFEERFWNNVGPKTPEGCILWIGPKTPKGYGVISRNDATVRPHRFMYEVAYGPIPKGLHVCHKCDNPSCIRPDHLFLGTNQDNVNDSKAKNRRNRPIGQRNPRARLTEEIVRECRRRHKAGGVTLDQLAEEFNVYPSTMWFAVSGTTWSHIT